MRDDNRHARGQQNAGDDYSPGGVYHHRFPPGTQFSSDPIAVPGANITSMQNGVPDLREQWVARLALDFLNSYAGGPTSIYAEVERAALAVLKAAFTQKP